MEQRKQVVGDIQIGVQKEKYKGDVMTVKEAYEISKKQCVAELGSEGELFAPVFWKSPESNAESGPFWILITRDIAIEVTSTGEFKSWYPATADHYYPYFKKSLKGSEKKKRIKTAIEKLLDNL